MHHSSFSASSSPPGAHLRVDGVSLSYGGHRVLTDVSLVVPAGERAGLIGENGSGKSTLLKVIGGLLTPTAGTVAVQGSADPQPAVGLLHQEPPFGPDESVATALQAALAPARAAAEAVTQLSTELGNAPDDPKISDAYARAVETADHLGAWEVEARIAASLAGLGLASLDHHRPTGQLSGGQRARLALACLLLSAPGVLLLDEPSNHLDDAAVEYLLGVLRTWRGPVLMASHDRAFLDEAATSILDLDPTALPHAVAGPLMQDGTGTGIGLTRFTGSYSDYLQAHGAARLRWERQYRDEQAELARLRGAIKEHQVVGHVDWKPRTEARVAAKFYSDRNARVISRRVSDARVRWDELNANQIRKPPAALRFRGLTAAGSPAHSSTVEPVLTAVEVAVAGRLSPTSLSINRAEKWLITGANGSGKSTLLSTLAGLLPPTSGQITASSGDRVRLLAQETTLADPHERGLGRTVAETYIDLVGASRAEQVPLGAFGLIAQRDHHRPVAELSIGQQRRLALAVLLADPPEILLLDEPTNHFSLTLATAIEEALTDYPGTVVLASHDRWLRRRWLGHHLALATSPAAPQPGGPADPGGE